MLDLPSNQLALIQDMLRRHLPGRAVIAFGSRTNGKARPYSDLDLCVMGNEPPDWRKIGDLKADLEDSPLPIRVDVLEWANLSADFRRIIETQPTIAIQ
jgi:predicted nucleotidyltransferase